MMTEDDMIFDRLEHNNQDIMNDQEENFLGEESLLDWFTHQEIKLWRPVSTKRMIGSPTVQ